MEDVVLHYQPGSADGLSSLLEKTQKLLEPFPCRTPPVFTPWFPAAASDRRRPPIRPAKPAPVITSSGDLVPSHHGPPAETKPQPEIKIQTAEHHCRPHAETPPLPARQGHAPRPAPEKQPQKDKDGVPATSSPVKRSWSVFAPRGVLLQSSQSLSKQFDHMVSVHRLHLRQRAKWVIRETNCGAADLEQVWRTLTRSVQSSRLPTCNANIQRERAEIWVFCDVLYSEQVGRFLKDELQLSGRISLSVHGLGNVFSL